jgi:acetolactate synthase-1/2/3 large subunit
MLDLTRPNLDFVQLAEGLGVDAVRPADNEELVAAIERALTEPGPHLIEAVVPSGF